MEQATLQTLLYHRFSEYEASLLNYFFTNHAADTNLSYQEIDLTRAEKNDLILQLDLHDTIDLFVINGIMSPCPQKSLITGLSWYEISPAMFWG